MRLVYLSDARVPSRSSNSMQVMRMCDAFALAGAEVTLFHARPRPEQLPEGFTGNLTSFYGVGDTFKLQAVRPPPRWVAGAAPIDRAVRFISYVSTIHGSVGGGPFLAYGRSFVGCSALVAMRRWASQEACQGIVMEIHDLPRTRAAWRLLGAVDGIVAISEALRARLVRRQPALASRTWVEHDAVDLRAIRPELLDRARARRELGLADAESYLVAYTGRALPGKGVDILLDAARRLPTVRFLVVGRVYDDGYLRVATPNVGFTGFVPPSRVPKYLAAADVLVMPTTDDLPYAEFTSPLKLFEYMASGRPVVSSDLPAVSEVIRHGENALLYSSRDASGLAAAIERVLNDPALGASLAERAWRDVQKYGWNARAERIIDSLKQIRAPTPTPS
jgi:glycosyltransferase involved in cell wall biosynthesis